MRKLSIAILVAAILAGLIFYIVARRHHGQQPFTGIGVALALRNHTLEIMGVLPDTPAAKAGLHSGLIIQEINGVSVVNKPLKLSVAMTRGPVGSIVLLKIVDPATSSTNIVELTRETFYLPVGNGKMRAAPVAH